MATLTQPLREEHQELLPHIEALLATAHAVGNLPAAEVRAAVDASYDFLSHHLLPHAQAEERVLYPAIGRALGAPDATKTMSRDHVEVERLTAELAALRDSGPDDVSELRRVLYGLYALIKVHFAKEEEVYLPILDARLSSEEAREMFESMERAAGDAKAHSPA